jgi:hypothetical protein
MTGALMDSSSDTADKNANRFMSIPLFSRIALGVLACVGSARMMRGQRQGTSNVVFDSFQALGFSLR